jgi:ADP-ribosylglycohydrolase
VANANVGGENVHRGSILGAILGARAGYDRLPPRLVDGLYDKANLAKEIDDFIQVVMNAK